MLNALQKAVFWRAKDGLLQRNSWPFATQKTAFRSTANMQTEVKLSFFDKYLLKKFGTYRYCPYLCISKNDK